MSSMSDYLENKVIDHMLRAQAYTPPATLYLALFTASTGLEANNPTAEVSGGGYARQAITLSAASGGATSISAAIEFPEATANWGTITHCALVDHETNTSWGTNVNVLLADALTDSKAVDSGDVLRFKAGEIDLTFA